MKKIYCKLKCVLLAASMAVLLAGCTNESREEELAYRQAGIDSMEIGDYEAAVAAFEQALGSHVGRITEQELDICYYKAAAQYASGDVEGAMETYNALLDYDGSNADAYYLRGCLYLQQGVSQQALYDYANAVKNSPDDFELYISIYENLTAYQLAAEGEEYLNKAFDIKGGDADSLTWRGKIYYLLGEYDNAVTELKAAIEKGSVTANLYLAQTYEAQGDVTNAEACYQAYVTSDEADSQAMNALAEIEMSRGNYAGALDYISQGLGMEDIPNRRELMQNQIIANEYAGDFAAAWTVVQEYIALYPDDTAIQREYIFLKNRQDIAQPPQETPPTEDADEPPQDTGAAE